MVVLVSVNLVSVFVAALIPMVLGMIWYSPSVFGTIWMKMSGLDMKKLAAKKKKMGLTYFLNFLSALVMSYILAHFVAYAGATDIIGGIQAGTWIWLGFIATTMLGTVFWEGKPFKLYLLNSCYYLVALVLMGALLAAW